MLAILAYSYCIWVSLLAKPSTSLWREQKEQLHLKNTEKNQMN